MERILAATIDTAVTSKTIKPAEFERIIVDGTVQEKAMALGHPVAYPVDSRLLEIARHKIVVHAKRCGIALRQSFAKEGKALKRKAGGYAHAKQFKRLQRTVKRQRTIVGKLIREVRNRLSMGAFDAAASPATWVALNILLERAERIRTQQPQDKNKLYALHAPEVECISKGKARNRYEFGVKVSLAVTHKQGLMVGAKRFVGNPYGPRPATDGHTLAAQISQCNDLIKSAGSEVKQAFVDLGYRGVDADGPRPATNPDIEVIHRGRIRSMSERQKRQLKRRQAIEPAIGHVKHDNRMIRCYLHGSIGDALHAIALGYSVSCAAGYNIRWLMRAIMRLGLRGLFACVFLASWISTLARPRSPKVCLAFDNSRSTRTIHLRYALI